MNAIAVLASPDYPERYRVQEYLAMAAEKGDRIVRSLDACTELVVFSSGRADAALAAARNAAVPCTVFGPTGRIVEVTP